MVNLYKSLDLHAQKKYYPTLIFKLTLKYNPYSGDKPFVQIYPALANLLFQDFWMLFGQKFTQKGCYKSAVHSWCFSWVFYTKPGIPKVFGFPNVVKIQWGFNCPELPKPFTSVRRMNKQ